jgi:hypothetical protein
MTLRRFALFTAFLLLGLGWSVTAQAQGKNYPLVAGSGGQSHIGGGLALPIQPAAQAPVGIGTNFPPLLVQPVDGAYAVVTTAMTTQQKIVVQPAQLSKAAGQTTVGVATSNPTLYAVATNLNYAWPHAVATFSTGAAARPGGTTATFFPGPVGQSIVYNSSALASKFGGAARFAVSSPGGGGLIPSVPVTVFVRAFGGPVPCTHTDFGGAQITCRAGLLAAYPGALGAAGADIASPAVSTPGTPAPNPGTAALKVGNTPGIDGTIISANLGASPFGLTNMASSKGYPWTAGKLSIIAASAAGAPETFVISGKDERTQFGGGSIQLVSGALSTRPLSGDNANRSWIRLVLGSTGAPAMSPLAQGAMAGLIALGGGYLLRRRLITA